MSSPNKIYISVELRSKIQRIVPSDDICFPIHTRELGPFTVKCVLNKFLLCAHQGQAPRVSLQGPWASSATCGCCILTTDLIVTGVEWQVHTVWGTSTPRDFLVQFWTSLQKFPACGDLVDLRGGAECFLLSVKWNNSSLHPCLHFKVIEVKENYTLCVTWGTGRCWWWHHLAEE